jgi:hypothetical protein
VFSCEILLACELILVSCLLLLRCFRRGNVKCLRELIKDFDFCGLSFPIPLRGTNGEDVEYGLVAERWSVDRGSVDAKSRS